MQAYDLTVDKFLDHAAKWFGDREIVEADAGTVIARTGYAGLRERSNLCSGALLSLGLQFGDRVGTLAWNTQAHLELYYAAMGVGLVCHTLNPRLTVAQIAAIVNEAQDRVLAVAANLSGLVEQLVPLCPCVQRVIVIDERAGPRPDLGSSPAQLWSYESLLAERGVLTRWGGFDERAAAGLCYTSGTTGKPKGVLYTHRSNYLHTLRELQADAIGLTSGDSVLLAVPMCHANAWGIPFAAPAVGAKLVLPGRQIDGASLARLMADEVVTVAVGVQTVWLSLVDHLEATGATLPTLERVLIGGSNCPDALIRRMEEVLGATVQTSWGMTEFSPTGTITPPDAPVHERGSSGRPTMGLDLKLTDAAGRTLPEQRGVTGHLKARGHSVIARYYGAEADSLDEEGYFDTGDLASIDPAGYVTISGRSKDLIKSGGEWINPVEIETIVGRDPAVALVAVIGRPDPRWGERPLLVVEPRQGQTIDPAALVAGLRGQVADWWLPDRVAQVAAMPLAASGKIDKQRLREYHARGALEGERVGR